MIWCAQATLLRVGPFDVSKYRFRCLKSTHPAIRGLQNSVPNRDMVKSRVSLTRVRLSKPRQTG